MTIADKRPQSRASGPKTRTASPKDAAAKTAPASRTSARPARRLLFVFGMHRSGTSMVTRVINLAGASLPRNLIPAGEGNPLGHWEPAEAVALNEAVLSSAGLHWHSLANMPPGWFETGEAAVYVDRAAALLRDELPDDSTLAVFKDPRLCRLAPLWIRAAEQAGWQPSAILVLRNPLEIAASLKSRNSFLPAKSQMMTLKHILEAERASRTLPRSIVTYDQMLSDWRGGLARIGADLGLRWPRLSFKVEVEIDGYVSESQRHHRVAPGADAAVSAGLGGSLFRLLADASSGKPLDTAALDQIAERLTAAESVFGPLMAIAESSMEASDRRIAQLMGDVAGLQAHAGGLQAEVERLNAALGAQDREETGRLAAALAAAEGERDAARQGLADLSGRLAAVEGERAAAGQEIAAMAGRLATAEGERDAIRQEVAGLHERLAAAEAEREAAHQGLADLSGRLATAEGERDAVRQQVAGLSEQLGTAGAEREAARQETAAMAGRLATAEGERDAARQEVVGLSERLAAAEAERDMARQEIASLSEQLDTAGAARQASSQEVAGLAKRLAAAEAERDTARREVAGLHERLAESGAARAAASRQSAEAAIRLAELEERLVTLSAEKSDREQRLQHLQEMLDAMSNQNALQSNTLADLQVRFNEIESHLARLFERIAELERENGALVQERERLRQECAQLYQERERLSLALAKAESERPAVDVQTLVGERNALTAERDSLIQHASALDRRRMELESELARSGEENRALHAAVGQLTTRNDMQSQQIADHLARFTQIDESIGLLYRQIQELETERNELTRQVEAMSAGLECRDRQIAGLVLQGLLRGLGLHPEGFDAAFYLTCNPDVSDAIQNGHIATAFEHWLLWGVWENRTASFRPVGPVPGVDPGLVRRFAMSQEGPASRPAIVLEAGLV